MLQWRRSPMSGTVAVIAVAILAWATGCGSKTEKVADCSALTCPAGHTANTQTCKCEPSADKCHGVSCTGGQACNPDAGACEASPGGGAIRTDLVNKQMSLGVHNNGGNVPNGVEEVYLDFNWSVSPKNQIVSVAVPSGAITIDGANTSTSEWQGVPETTLSLMRGSDLISAARRTNGTVNDIVTEEFGISSVKVRSAYDGSYIYFRVEWSDTTENSDRGRWIYADGGGWTRDTSATQALPAGNKDTTRAVTNNEDRAQLMFNVNIPDFFGTNANQGLGRGCAGLCHLEGKTGSDVATVSTVSGVNYYTGKGRMYTYDAGLKADLWHWKANRSNALRVFDDQYFDNEKRKGDGSESDEWKWTGTVDSNSDGTPDCKDKVVDGARYSDAGSTELVMLHFGNEFFADATGCPSQGPSRVPWPFSSSPFAKYMYEENSPLISTSRGPEGVLVDAGYAYTPSVGDLLPGYIFRTRGSGPTCKRCNNETEGKWANNTWIVEFKRSLVAPDSNDVDFTKAQ